MTFLLFMHNAYFHAQCTIHALAIHAQCQSQFIATFQKLIKCHHGVIYALKLAFNTCNSSLKYLSPVMRLGGGMLGLSYRFLEGK